MVVGKEKCWGINLQTGNQQGLPQYSRDEEEYWPEQAQARRPQKMESY